MVASVECRARRGAERYFGARSAIQQGTPGASSFHTDLEKDMESKKLNAAGERIIEYKFFETFSRITPEYSRSALSAGIPDGPGTNLASVRKAMCQILFVPKLIHKKGVTYLATRGDF